MLLLAPFGRSAATSQTSLNDFIIRFEFGRFSVKYEKHGNITLVFGFF